MSIYIPTRKVALVVGDEDLCKTISDLRPPISHERFKTIKTDIERAYEIYLGIRPDVVVIKLDDPNSESVKLLNRLYNMGLTSIVTTGKIQIDSPDFKEIIGKPVAHLKNPGNKTFEERETLEKILIKAEAKTIESRKDMLGRVLSLSHDRSCRYEGKKPVPLDPYYGEALKKISLSMPFLGDSFRKESRFGVLVIDPFDIGHSGLKDDTKSGDHLVFKMYKNEEGHKKVLKKWKTADAVKINHPNCTHYYVEKPETHGLDIEKEVYNDPRPRGSVYAINTFMFGPTCEYILSVLNKNKKDIAKRAKKVLMEVMLDKNVEWYISMSSLWVNEVKEQHGLHESLIKRIEDIKTNYNNSLLDSLRTTREISTSKFGEEEIRDFIDALDINSAVEPFSDLDLNIIFNIGLIDFKPPNISFKLDKYDGLGVVKPNQKKLIDKLEELEKEEGGLRKVFTEAYSWNDCSERDGPVQEDLAHMLENPETGLNREERIRYFSHSMHGLFNPVLNGKDSGRLWSPYSKIGIWMAFRKIYLYTEEFMLTNEYNLISEAISKEDFEKQQRAAVEKLHYWARSQKELAAMNHLAVSIMDEDDASFINIERALRENFVNPEKSREYSNNLLSRGLPKNPTTLVEKSLYVHNWLHKFVHLPSSYNLFYQSYLPNPVSVSVVNL